MIAALKEGLIVTGIGMGLVFVMIFALWGIMALLVKLTNRPEKAEEVEEDETPILHDDAESESTPLPDHSRLAAAIAVSYALLNEEQSRPIASGTPIANGWLTAGRIQQVNRTPNRGR